MINLFYRLNSTHSFSYFTGTSTYKGDSVVKYLPANVGDAGLIPGLGRSPGEENGNPDQYSCLGNLMDR